MTAIYLVRDVKVRIERHSDSPRDFTNIGNFIPIDFSGETVELRGFLRTEDVSDFAGLAMLCQVRLCLKGTGGAFIHVRRSRMRRRCWGQSVKIRPSSADVLFAGSRRLCAVEKEELPKPAQSIAQLRQHWRRSFRTRIRQARRSPSRTATVSNGLQGLANPM